MFGRKKLLTYPMTEGLVLNSLYDLGYEKTITDTRGYGFIYQVPINPAQAIRYTNSHNYIKQDGILECPEFCDIYKGYLAIKGLGNTLAMRCSVMEEGRQGHRLIAFLQDNKLVFGEPETGKILLKETTDRFKVLKLRIS